MSTPEAAAAYEPFAWFYNRYWNDQFHGAAFPILERILLPLIPAGARVLDVCCGTGYLAGLLQRRGFRVTGVDGAAEMVRYAKENVRGAEFHVADARAFRFPPQFQAAVSTFDSVNHILEPEELEQMFRNVGGALEPDAPFVFDALLEEAYQTHWAENFALVEDDHVLTITGGGFDERRKLARCRITMFRLIDDLWRRCDVTVTERCYSGAEIEAALESAGFGELSCYDARDLGMEGELGAGRVFFRASARPV